MGRRRRDVYTTPVDLEILAALEATRSIVDACARLSITRDTGMYRLRRLAGALGSPVVVSRRGGSTRGGTVLTDLGRRVLREGVGPLAPASEGRASRLGVATVLAGEWHARPQARISLADGTTLFVGFAAKEGEAVRVGIEPEAIVVARGRFPSSARNVLRGTVESVHRQDDLRSFLWVRVGRRARLAAAITPASQARLRLTPGTTVYLYLKATAVHRVP